jgi:pilus assembly protein CpaE
VNTRGGIGSYWLGKLGRKTESGAADLPAARPVKRGNLYSLSNSARAPRSSGLDENDEKLRRILLVEDSTTLSLLYQQYLKQAGFEVTSVASGKEAIRALADGYAAVALDLGLPDMDGLAVLKHIQSLEAPPSALIITSNASLGSAVEAMRLGAFDYLVKPITPERLASTVRDAIAFGAASGRSKTELKPTARCLTFIGARGGVGTTSIAVHVALLAARRNKNSSNEACIVDLDLLNGACAEYLDVQPAWDLDEIIADPSRLDGRMVELMTSQHKQGVAVISTRRSFGERFDFPPTIVTRTMDIASQKYQSMIIDLPRYDESWSDGVIMGSSEVFVVTDYSVPGLKAARRMMNDLIAKYGADLKIKVIINKYSRSMFGNVISAATVKDLLGDNFAGYVAADDRLVREAIDRGLPTTDLKSRNAFVSDIAKIVGY